MHHQQVLHKHLQKHHHQLFLLVLKKLTMILKLHTWIIIPVLNFQFQNLVLKNPLLRMLFQIIFNQPPEHINKWTKDHPIDNVIGDPSRMVSTRQQLQDKALFCYFDAFLSSVEPKSYKDALKESCWIESIQEELNEFERLEVWELVPRPDRVMIITLKWIYKVKLDELGGV
ncbi:retrovirus-related pol polyprotein from transposon TNT 1-94 [Tanacetum coccineum]